jgi:DNA polymerase I-like protein with 3'-5' exonuclease and polymerase domains
VTLRLAAEDPNVQQLPIKVKNLFEAPKGWKFIKHDENALEVRGLANQSKDPTLIERIIKDLDLHWVHATSFMHLPYSTPKDKKKRHGFKTLFFGSGYGALEEKVSLILRDEFWTAGIGMDVVLEILHAYGIDDVQIAHDEYHDVYRMLARAWLVWLEQEYPGLKSSFNTIVTETKHRGFIRSWFGAERRLPEIHSKDKYLVGEAERMAFNFPPQNLSLVTFIAYRELRKERERRGWEHLVKLVLQEHDSIMYLAHESIANEWDAIMKMRMEDIDFAEWGSTFAVPLKSEGSVKQRWV